MFTTLIPTNQIIVLTLSASEWVTDYPPPEVLRSAQTFLMICDGSISKSPTYSPPAEQCFITFDNREGINPTFWGYSTISSLPPSLDVQCVAAIWCVQGSSTTPASTSAQTTTSGSTAPSVTAATSTSAGRWCLPWGGPTTRDASSAASAGTNAH